MVKQTKRQRKFQTSGGIKNRIDKGTITKHGKLRKTTRNKTTTTTTTTNSKTNNDTNNIDNNNDKRKLLDKNQTLKKKKGNNNDDDDPSFLGEENLAGLDLDSFFEHMTDKFEKFDNDDDNDKNDNSNDNDDDDDDEEEEDDDNDNDSEVDDEQMEEEDDDSKPSIKSDMKKRNDEDDDEDDNSSASSNSSDSSSNDGVDYKKSQDKMKAQLAKLHNTDPEFHKFLQENEESLLEFGNDDEDDDEEDDDDDDDDDEDGEEEDDEDDDDNVKSNKASKEQNEMKVDDDKKEKKKTVATDDDENNNGSGMIRLTSQILKQLTEQAFDKHHIKALKKMITIYKDACHIIESSGNNKKQQNRSSNKDTDKDDSTSKKKKMVAENEKIQNQQYKAKYIIDSSQLFDDLMIICLEKFPIEFQYHLLGDSNVKEKGNKNNQNKHVDDDEKKEGMNQSNEDNDADDDEELVNTKPIQPTKLEKSSCWIQMKAILVSFYQSTIHLLMEAKDNELLAYVLKSLSKSIRYLSPLHKTSQLLIRQLIVMWSAPFDSDVDYQMVRIQAFLRIREMALTQPFPFIEDILKKTYLAYARRAKYGSSSSSSSSITSSALPTITFMGNCLVELYNLDYNTSYQHAFVYIRQLALLLRNAMQKKTPEEIQQVYCWQYFHCLKLWVAILSSACHSDNDIDINNNKDSIHMRSLIYPLTEIILGTVRFIPSPVRYIPCRFHCIRLLQQLASSSETFIPTSSLILNCFDWKEWYLSPKKITKKNNNGNSGSTTSYTIKGLQLTYILKLPGKTDFLRTHEQLELCINELFLLLRREIDLYRYSAGFPEYTIRIENKLKYFIKHNAKNARWRTYAKSCIDLIHKYSNDVIMGRSKLVDAPKDIKRLECLLPHDGKTMRIRYEESIADDEKQKNLGEKMSTAPTKSNTTESSNTDNKRKRQENEKNGKNDDDDDDEVEEKDEEEVEMNDASLKKKKRKKNKKKKKLMSDNAVIDSKKVDGKDMMKISDSVKEGIHWSDDEDDNEEDN